MRDPNAGPPPGDDVARVRGLLRDRGYLSSPLEHYVIASGPTGRSTAAWDLKVAAKVGALSGLFFSALLGLQALAQNPELARRPRDLGIWMAYLLAATSIPVGLLDAMLGLVLRLVPVRRPDRLARGAGAIMGALLLLLLAGLWLGEPLEPAGPLQTGASVVLLGCLAVLVSRLVSISVIAFSMRLGAVPEAPRRRGAARSVAWLLVASATLASAYVASGAWDASRQGPREPAPFGVFPPPHAVDLLGIDGLSWEDASSIPALAALAAEGYASPLAPPPDGWDNPAEIWTTVVTGLPGRRHGVRSMEVTELPGMSTPVRGAPGAALAVPRRILSLLKVARPRALPAGARTAKALWEILAEKERPVAVVNFWGTSPAQEPAGGAMVGEGAFFALLAGRSLGAEVAPASVREIVAGRMEALPDAAELPCGPVPPRQCRAVLTDRFHWDVMRAVHDARPAIRAGASLLYLPGRDIGRYLGRTHGPLQESAARLSDRVLEEAVAPREDRTLLVVATPGRGAPAGTRGLLLMAGPGVRRGAPVEAATLLDVAPTYLYLAGFPTSADLPGRVLADAADDAFRATWPVRRIATFGDRSATGSPAPQGAGDIYEDLRSLGYVR